MSDQHVRGKKARGGQWRRGLAGVQKFVPGTGPVWTEEELLAEVKRVPHAPGRGKLLNYFLVQRKRKASYGQKLNAAVRVLGAPAHASGKVIHETLILRDAPAEETSAIAADEELRAASRDLVRQVMKEESGTFREELKQLFIDTILDENLLDLETLKGLVDRALDERREESGADDKGNRIPIAAQTVSRDDSGSALPAPGTSAFRDQMTSLFKRTGRRAVNRHLNAGRYVYSIVDGKRQVTVPLDFNGNKINVVVPLESSPKVKEDEADILAKAKDILFGLQQVQPIS